MIKWFSGFDSRFVRGPGHIKDIKSGSDLCLHGTQDKGGTMKDNWSTWCQYNVTWRVSKWAYDMLSH